MWRNAAASSNAFLEFITDKEEWSVKVSLQRDSAVDWLIQTDRELSERHRRLSPSPGVRYLQEKQIKAVAGKQLQARSRHHADEMLSRLRGLALDVRELKRNHLVPDLAGPAGGEAGELVFNGACLLPIQGIEAFHQEVERARRAGRPQGILVETRGPWPPYHFCPKWSEPV